MARAATKDPRWRPRSRPRQSTVGPRGDLYFDDLNGFRTIDTAGIIHAFAGTGVAGFSGDAGPAVDAPSGRAHQPGSASLRTARATYTSVTRATSASARSTAPGVITPVAGTGVEGYSATQARPWTPPSSSIAGLAVDAAGDLFFADTGSVSQDRCTTGVITTVAGTGSSRLLRRLRAGGGCTGGTLEGGGPRRDRVHRRRRQLTRADGRAVDSSWDARLRRPRWWPAGVSESLATGACSGPRRACSAPPPATSGSRSLGHGAVHTTT